MKHRILLFLFGTALMALLSACSEYDKLTTYTVISEYNNELWDNNLLVFECNDVGDKIAVHEIEDVEIGRNYLFTAVPAATKVKIYDDSLNEWYQLVYLLNKEGHTTIVLNGESIVGSKEP